MPDSKSETSYSWKPFSDLPEDIQALRDREIEALAQVWAKQRASFPKENAMTEFNTRLAREWAVETGIIEGVYTLDRGTTQTLIEHGIEAARIPRDMTNRDPELLARIIQSHADVLEGLFAFVKGDRAFSTGYVKELHAALLRYQENVTVFDQFGTALETPLLKGDYKRLPNNPSREDGSVHEYCPPEHVASEMDRLIALHAEHVGKGVRPEIESAWLHHAFTQIHPFQDGNGRVARAIATLVFLKAELFPLVIANADKGRYIDYLEQADSGDLQGLVRFFSRIQKRLLTKAIGLAVDVKPASNTTEAIEATRDLLIDLGRIFPKEWLNSQNHAGRLANYVSQKNNQMIELLRREIASVNPRFVFAQEGLEPPPFEEIDKTARLLQYDPDVQQYHQSIQLTLKGPSSASRVVVSFHGVGVSFRGLLVASAYTVTGSKEPVVLSDDIFRIRYDEAPADLDARFGRWLEECMTKAITLWRRTLV